MRYKFDKSCYLSAVKTLPTLNDDVSIAKTVQEKSKFNHCKVDFKKFSEKYSSDNWFGRKIIALPAALIAGIVKTTYHLVKLLLIGIPAAIFGKTEYVKAYTFTIIRDLQESFGYFICFFNDKYGSYHIQESQFQKSCYDCFLSEPYLYATFFDPIDPADAVNDSYLKEAELSYSEGNLEVSLKKPIDRDAVFAFARTCYHKGDLDNALKFLEKITHSGDDKNFLFTKMAEAYFEKGDLENTLKLASTINPNHETEEGILVRSTIFAKLADAYLKKKDWENTFKAAKELNIYDKNSDNISLKAFFLGEVVKAYLNEDELEKAAEALLVIVEQNLGTNDSQDDLCITLADTSLKKGKLDDAITYISSVIANKKVIFVTSTTASFIGEGKLDDALKVVKKLVPHTELGNTLSLQIAEAYYQKGNMEQAVMSIDYLLGHTKAKESLIAKVAEAYFQKNDLGMALENIEKLVFDKETKTTFTIRIAEAYIDNGNNNKNTHNLFTAESIINRSTFSIETRESLFVKLAEAFLAVGSQKKASKIHNTYLRKTENRDILFANITQSYFNEHNEEKVLSDIWNFVEHHLKLKFQSDYPGAETPLAIPLASFFDKLSKDCYSTVKADFQAKHPQEAFAKIKQIATSKESVDAFLKLPKGT